MEEVYRNLTNGYPKESCLKGEQTFKPSRLVSIRQTSKGTRRCWGPAKRYPFAEKKYWCKNGCKKQQTYTQPQVSHLSDFKVFLCLLYSRLCYFLFYL